MGRAGRAEGRGLGGGASGGRSSREKLLGRTSLGLGESGWGQGDGRGWEELQRGKSLAGSRIRGAKGGTGACTAG